MGQETPRASLQTLVPLPRRPAEYILLLLGLLAIVLYSAAGLPQASRGRRRHDNEVKDRPARSARYRTRCGAVPGPRESLFQNKIAVALVRSVSSSALSPANRILSTAPSFPEELVHVADQQTYKKKFKKNRRAHARICKMTALLLKPHIHFGQPPLKSVPIAPIK